MEVNKIMLRKQVIIGWEKRRGERWRWWNNVREAGDKLVGEETRWKVMEGNERIGGKWVRNGWKKAEVEDNERI